MARRLLCNYQSNLLTEFEGIWMKRKFDRVFGLAVAAAFVALGLVLTSPAEAGFLQMEEIPGNACAGFFGHGFSNCRVDGSPSIIKFDGDLGVSEISVNFPSVDGSEFLFSDPTTDNVTGTWEYSQDIPGGDPLVRFWSAKAGPGFYLFYYTAVDDEIRSMALAVDHGTWMTPDGKALSNLVFYDSGEFPSVDEPATLVLMGLALIGFGMSRRRKIISR
jgi:hypothetical protein